MIVVSNTSPLSYLVVIDRVELLSRLFGGIVIPETVCNELASPKAPQVVQQWIAAAPVWLAIEVISECSDLELQKLDAGERAAILLAERLNTDLILLDDLAARHLAASRGLSITGTLGILDRAATENWIDFAVVVARLQQTNFRASTAIVQELLQKHHRPS